MDEADLIQIVHLEFSENIPPGPGISDSRAIADRIAVTHGIEGDDVERLIPIIKKKAKALGLNVA